MVLCATQYIPHSKLAQISHGNALGGLQGERYSNARGRPTGMTMAPASLLIGYESSRVGN
jgi:hypothetical protein